MSNISAEQVLQFLRNHIESVEQLEILSLIFEHPSREWTISTLSLELRSSEIAIGKRLSALVSARVLLAPDDSIPRYRPACQAQSQLLEEVLAFYRLRPHRVLEILYSKPVSAMQSFADAFRFKKDSE